MSPTRMSKIEAAIRVVLVYHEAFNRQDAPGVMELVSEDCLLETRGPAPDGRWCSGKEAMRPY